MVKEILKLGNPKLYEISEEITTEDFPMIKEWVKDLHDTLCDYRMKYGAGRAIAAPQIGIQKRLIYMLVEKEYVFINPVIVFPNEELIEVLDDCMSFPGLCVKVMRYKQALLTYIDIEGTEQKMLIEGDISELIQHEHDHLDGILATMRAKDNKSLYFMQMKR